MLEIRNIVHYYEERLLLDGVSFDVRENEVLCLLGSSGSGKSTMLRIIAGLEKPKSGEILRNSVDISDMPVHQRNFGMVFQDYALFPHMTVTENVAFGLQMHHVSKSEIASRVKNVLQMVGMGSFADRRVTELSGGEQQRIALARSLVVDPDLLMLDEPLGALDYALRRSLIEELQHILGKNGIPAIYVTHDQEEAFALSNRIALLHNGKIVQLDTPEQIFRHPADRWCAEFLGLNNLVPVHYDGNDLPVMDNFGTPVAFPAAQKDHEKTTLLLNSGEIVSEPKPDGFGLRGIVDSVTYRGTFYDVTAEISEGTLLTVRSVSERRIGDEILLNFDPENCTLLQ